MVAPLSPESAATRELVDLLLWGKTVEGAADRRQRSTDIRPYPLLGHLLDTADYAMILWDRWLKPDLRALIVRSLTSPASPDEERARVLVALAAGLHDVGKISLTFQGQTRSPFRDVWFDQIIANFGRRGYATGRVDGADGPPVSRHEVLSHAIVSADGGPTRDTDLERDWLAIAVGGHHGTFYCTDEDWQLDALEELQDGKWGDQHQAHLDAVLQALDLTRDDLQTRMAGQESHVALILICGLVAIADWLASDDLCVEYGQATVAGLRRLAQMGTEFSSAPAGWIERRRAWMNRRFDQTVGQYQPPADAVQSIMGDHAKSLSDLQKAALQTGDGMEVVMFPAGEGKTETALLRHSTANEGIIFALPTRATSEAMLKRVNDAFAGTSNLGTLAHAQGFLHDFYRTPAQDGDVAASRWATSRLKRLLTPLVVGTCDQVLAGALRQAHAPVRLLCLANSHLVLDEVHTFDQYQTELLADVLTWLGRVGTRVTLLSATLPTWQLNLFTQAYNPDTRAVVKGQVPYPGTVHVPPRGTDTIEKQSARVAMKSRRYYVQRLTLAPNTSHGTITDWAIEQRRQYPNARIGLRVNTVGRCIATARRLIDAGDSVLVLHSRMTQQHRAEAAARIEARVGKKAPLVEPATIVGTQVIEASLDLDLDLAATDLAVASSIIQFAGRVWRNDKHPGRWQRLPGYGSTGEVMVFYPVDDDGRYADTGTGHLPYVAAETTRAYEWLKQRSLVAVPGDVQDFIDSASLSLQELLVLEADPSAGLQEEIGEAVKRLHAARRYRSMLDAPGEGYLSAPSYLALQALTALADSELDVEMSTRFIDRVTGIYVPVGDTSRYAWNGNLRDLAALTWRTRGYASQLERFLRASIPVSAGLIETLDAAHERTIAAEGLKQWKPAATALTHIRPVNLAYADGLRYDDDLGLTQITTRH